MSRVVKWMLCIMVLFVSATVLDAGGWAVVTITAPDTVIVGQPVTVTYAVRQHGQRLIDDLRGHVEARLGDTVIKATANGRPAAGNYLATLTLPRAGT